MRGGTLAALMEHHEPMEGPRRELPRRSPRNQAMNNGFESMVSFCWLRHPPWHAAVSGGPSTAGGAQCPFRAGPSHAVQTEQESPQQRYTCASAVAELDLS
eukprot:5595420-Pyramimonas_sp.AAC.1